MATRKYSKTLPIETQRGRTTIKSFTMVSRLCIRRPINIVFHLALFTIFLMNSYIFIGSEDASFKSDNVRKDLIGQNKPQHLMREDIDENVKRVKERNNQYNGNRLDKIMDKLDLVRKMDRHEQKEDVERKIETHDGKVMEWPNQVERSNEILDDQHIKQNNIRKEDMVILRNTLFQHPKAKPLLFAAWSKQQERDIQQEKESSKQDQDIQEEKESFKQDQDIQPEMESSKKKGPLHPIEKRLQKMNTGFENCYTTIYSEYEKEPIKTPYKIYVYDLHPRYNQDLAKCISHQVEYNVLEQCGFGAMMYQIADDVAFTKTWQFSLDIILHHKLLSSPYRTLNPDEADLFYIPFYEASHCFCKHSVKDLKFEGKILEQAVFGEISRMPYYGQGKPHVLAIAKIEREERTLLKEEWTRNVTKLGIEAEDKRSGMRSRDQGEFIVVPYPSYVHYLQPDGGGYQRDILSPQHARPVFALLAASGRRSNLFRNAILDQMPHRASDNIEKYYSVRGLAMDTPIDSLWLETHESDGAHVEGTVRWMQKAQFCLQPPGDSPTRKSIYDCILCGCIPVFFADGYHPVVTLPFMDRIDYSKFSVTIPHNATENFWPVLEPYRRNPAKLAELQKTLQSVMHMFQYSFPIDNRPHSDALKYILDKLDRSLGLSKKQKQI